MGSSPVDAPHTSSAHPHSPTQQPLGHPAVPLSWNFPVLLSTLVMSLPLPHLRETWAGGPGLPSYLVALTCVLPLGELALVCPLYSLSPHQKGAQGAMSLSQSADMSDC